MNKKKYVIALSLIAALIVTLSVIVSVTHKLGNNTGKKDTAPLANAPPNDEGSPDAPTPAQSKNFQQVDELKEVETGTLPSGWAVQKSHEVPVNIATPNGWDVKGGVPPATTGETQSDNVYIVDVLPDPKSHRVKYTLYVRNQTLRQAAQNLEKNDVTDDGTVSTGPLKLISDIKKRDDFTINGVPAIKYVTTLRPSNLATPNVNIYYLMYRKPYLYMMLAREANGSDDTTALQLFKQL